MLTGPQRAGLTYLNGFPLPEYHRPVHRFCYSKSENALSVKCTSLKFTTVTYMMKTHWELFWGKEFILQYEMPQFVAMLLLSLFGKICYDLKTFCIVQSIKTAVCLNCMIPNKELYSELLCHWNVVKNHHIHFTRKEKILEMMFFFLVLTTPKVWRRVETLFEG